MTKRPQPANDRGASDRKQADRRKDDKSSSEVRKALRKESEAERRLIEREQLAADKVDRARQGLSEAVEKLAKAQGRVSRRADKLAEAEGELRLRQREREHGPHRSGVFNGYDSPSGGEASERPGQGAAADLGLIDDSSSTPPLGQGAATDAGLLDAPSENGNGAVG